jgi:LAO/AO transport system kinase
MTPAARRNLARDLSRIANAPVDEALFSCESEALRPIIGVTGAPGAGKSTLIGSLVQFRAQFREDGIAVLAIDPTSPFSGGAILGDRIRMAELANNPRVYIRSIATRGSADGLADNLPLLVDRVARESFAEIVVETTGVGQVEFSVRQIADTMVLVLTPGSGDSVQAMKSGIMEMPDIFVINKSDLPGAQQLANDIKSVIRLRAPTAAKGMCPVVMTCADGSKGIEELSAAIDSHRDSLPIEADDVRRWRWRVNLVRDLLARRSEELLGQLTRPTQLPDTIDLFNMIVHKLPFLSASGRTADIPVCGTRSDRG